MTLTISGFADFYRSVYGYAPFGWQMRLAQYVATSGRWPSHLDAPTGAGKSCVVDVHAYANALAATGAGARVPRRLAVVVSRRALVDSQVDRAENLARVLRQASEGILHEVRVALESLGTGEEPLRVVSLRGGQPTDRTWVDDPTNAMVIAATPDMWGSRLLFRGYGTSSHARPREAGLLAMDSVCVIDEAHLTRQLVRTAGDVARLVEGHAHTLSPLPPLQVVSSTATQIDGDSQAEGVTEEDLLGEDGLRQRLCSPKILSIVPGPDGPVGRKQIDALVERALAVSQSLPEHERETVLVVANRRATAAAVAELLSAKVGQERVACWAGRMRPMDVNALRSERPGLLTIAGHPGTDFLVTTQTAEVGVDLDCAALVTELAPGAALAQRFGRVNRVGRRDAASVHVVVSGGTITDQPPYQADDLELARSWLASVGDGGDASPWRLKQNPPPPETLRRLALSDVWGPDAALLARTTSNLFEEPDLAFWLRDELAEEPLPVGVVLRRLPESDIAALALLHQTPVVADEIFPASLGIARQVIARAFGDSDGSHHRAFRVREEQCGLIHATAQGLAPGDIVIVDHDVRVTWQRMLMPDSTTTSEPLPAVFEADEWQVVFPGQSVGGLDLCKVLAGSVEDAQATFDALVADGRMAGPRQVRIAPELIGDDRVLPWVVLVAPSLIAEDETSRQIWSCSGLVLLDVHQAAVAARVEAIAARLGLPDPVIGALESAGRLHDEGKQHPEFQRMLRFYSDEAVVRDVGAPLAKSAGRSAQGVRRLAVEPRGWRHEQLSAAYAHVALGSDDDAALAVRLVGTSHGRGRPFFPHGPKSLVGDADLPEDVIITIDDLYRSGAGWSDIVDRTDERFGVWGVAYLEAVLRAADGVVSREGS